MMRAGLIMLVVAIAFSIPLVLACGWPIVAIGLVSMACAYAYTGGPFPLAYRGMGELFVIFFFGIVAVTGSMFVQTGSFEILGVMVGVQVGLYSAVLIAINNSRDRAEDEGSRKFTLAVEMGLVNTVVPLAELEAETVKWAREIMQHSPLALRCLKAALNADCDGQMGLLDLAGNSTLLYYMSEEAKEGRDAFVEKREPDFSKFPRVP